MALHDGVSGGPLFGQPFWPTLLATGAALGFVATLLRRRARE
jgi:hypothetical protein